MSLSKMANIWRSFKFSLLQIVNELTETRLKLDEYKNAISKQDEAMQAMATKLADKSLQAEEAVEKCRSLQSDLDRSQSLLVSSGETASGTLFNKFLCGLDAWLNTVLVQMFDMLMNTVRFAWYILQELLTLTWSCLTDLLPRYRLLKFSPYTLSL